MHQMVTQMLKTAGDVMIETEGIRSVDGLLCREIGGGNGMELLYWSLLSGIPAVDACMRGRAFPELQMTTAGVYLGVKALRPSVVVDEKGHQVIVRSATTPLMVERLGRAACTVMGSKAGFVAAPLTGAELHRIAIPNCYSQAWRLGRTVLTARAAKRDVVRAVVEAENGRVLFEGKISDVRRRTAEGFTRGDLHMEGAVPVAGDDTSKPVEAVLHFQNEYLSCSIDGSCVELVPNLISVLETESGRAIGTEELRYGLRVSVIAIPCHPLLTTDEALKVLGPRAFGMDADFVQTSTYRKPRSVLNDDE